MGSSVRLQCKMLWEREEMGREAKRPLVLSQELEIGAGHYQFSSVAQSCLTLCNPMGCSWKLQGDPMDCSWKLQGDPMDCDPGSYRESLRMVKALPRWVRW